VGSVGPVVRIITYLTRLILVVALAASGCALAVVTIAPHAREFVDANSSRAAQVQVGVLARNSLVYAADGSLLGRLKGEQDRELVKLSDMSPQVVQSILAVEDADFYRHNGVNGRSIVRALIENVSAGAVQQGGSTITQQLVKNLVLDDNRKQVNRKLPEAALAIRLEQQMSKDEILELYLNTVYFGGGAYGVERAARLYFDKPAKDLDWPEGALLAALIRSPIAYDPIRNPKLAEQRRALALQRLVEVGDITEAQRRDFIGAPMPTQRHESDVVQDSYFLEEVKQRLLDDPRLGATRQDRIEALFAGGLQIYTTLDPKAQADAEQSIAETMDPLKDDRGFTAALAAVEPGTGKVRALVGGPGFDQFKFDIATQKGRPTGSSFKMFVLAAAMEGGYVPSDTIDGSSPCRFPNKGGTPDPYVAQNFGGSGGGGGTITSQTLRSSNCAYLRLAQIVGLTNVIATAHALGVNAQLDPVLSLPLGVFDITPLEMADAYATIANDGVRVDPVFVDKVLDADGKVILESKPTPTRAVSQQTARLVTDVLNQNVKSGTGTRAQLPRQPAAGKTGTAQDFADAWFVGFTPYLATAIWMGAPEGRVEMRNVGGVSGVTGGSFPAKMWGEFMSRYHEDLPVKPFVEPEKTRSGKALRTAEEQKAIDDYARTACGSNAAEVDTNGDGVADQCAPGTVGRYNGGACPRLLVAGDTNGDGVNDACVTRAAAATVGNNSGAATTTAPSGSTPSTPSQPATTGPP
jgi:penicillin-binding protein 1A